MLFLFRLGKHSGSKPCLKNKVSLHHISVTFLKGKHFLHLRIHRIRPEMYKQHGKSEFIHISGLSVKTSAHMFPVRASSLRLLWLFRRGRKEGSTQRQEVPELLQRKQHPDLEQRPEQWRDQHWRRRSIQGRNMSQHESWSQSVQSLVVLHLVE